MCIVYLPTISIRHTIIFALCLINYVGYNNTGINASTTALVNGLMIPLIRPIVLYRSGINNTLILPFVLN